MKINVLLASIQIRGIDGTGGLGDVPVGLSKVLAARGDVDVRLVMPGFSKISGTGLSDRFDAKHRVFHGLPVPLGKEQKLVDVYQINLPTFQRQQTTTVPDVPCYLFRCPEVFDATSNYGKDSPTIAVFFARSVMEFLRAHESFRVDLVHCNDWHTGLIPVYSKTLYGNDPYLGRVATLYTTHNAEHGYQGSFGEADDLLMLAGLHPGDVFGDPLKPSLNHHGKFNFCKGGFAFADIVNTVSQQYREELLTQAFGGGLDGLLLARRKGFAGVINGIDITEWDPRTDDSLAPYNFSVSDGPATIGEQKLLLRQKLRSQPAFSALDLNPNSILVGVVSRIDYQKSKILLRAIDDILRIDGTFQFAVLGAAGANDEGGRQQVEDLKRRVSNRLLFFNGYDIPLSHVLYAASEIFVVPSVFEPCGLTQLAAMKYGSVPVVRSVGGLVDTVIDQPGLSATGFRFKEQIANPIDRMDEEGAATALVSRLREALDLRASNQDRWNELVLNGMKRDSSWQVPSMQYVRLYHEAIRRRTVASCFGE